MDELLNELFHEKCEEFMEYQEHIVDRIIALDKELFTQSVYFMLKTYEKENRRKLTDGDLWLFTDNNCVIAQINPNKIQKVSTSRIYAKRIYAEPKDIDMLKSEIDAFHGYEMLLKLMEEKLPDMLHQLADWYSNYTAEQIAYLNSLHFPNEKPKHYVVTITIEEV